MNFRVNTVTDYSVRANKLNLSFVDVAGIPDGFTFSLFAPKSVPVTEGTVCDLPKFICNNIWHNQYSYIVKDLVKAAKKSVHHRNEKDEAAKKAVLAFEEAEKLNVEREESISGEYFGEVGQKVIVTLKNFKSRYIKEGTYTGIWKQTPSITGFCYWTHPSYRRVLWTAEDEEGHTFAFSTTSDKLNNAFAGVADEEKELTLTATVVGHNVFRFQKQTTLAIRYQKLAD